MFEWKEEDERMTRLTCEEIPKYVDISLVRTDVTYKEMELLEQIAKKYNFVCTFVMPCFVEEFFVKMKNSGVMVGGVVGFPSGAESTEIKIAQAKEWKRIGCQEVDMVINVGALRSGDYNRVKADIKAIVDTVYPTPVKSILEVAYLTDEEISIASKLAVEAGVTFVKSGTGWAGKPTTVETIKIMKEAVGDKALIKAAGGVRTLEVLEAMMDEGCTRFGIGLKSALSILKEAYDRDGIPFEDEELLANFDAKLAQY